MQNPHLISIMNNQFNSSMFFFCRQTFSLCIESHKYILESICLWLFWLKNWLFRWFSISIRHMNGKEIVSRANVCRYQMAKHQIFIKKKTVCFLFVLLFSAIVRLKCTFSFSSMHIRLDKQTYWEQHILKISSLFSLICVLFVCWFWSWIE